MCSKRARYLRLLLCSFFIVGSLQVRLRADDLPAGYRVIYKMELDSGLDSKKLTLQGPRQGSIAVVDAPGGAPGKAVKFSIRKDDEYGGVANGAPRAEINFGPQFRFEINKEYYINWSIFIPDDFAFDFKQPEGISQIHQGPNIGSPPWGLSLHGDHYQVDLRNGNGAGNSIQSMDAGSALEDKGKWVAWSFHYLPDGSGRNSISELFKDGKEILNANGKPNAFSGDSRSYFKFGVYKWWWKTKPSDVTERTVYFRDLIVGQK